MNIKNIIIIIIIIAALAGAGVLIYLSFFSGDKPAVALPASNSTTTTNPGAGSILPLGTKLDFSKVKEYNSSGRLFSYPTVKREETGLTLNEIISQ